ncbi:MAG: hypothetical protein PHN69_07830 [Candidatus Pacebacteria bacterium]|nr:hypothetical protein [Candidatus Paceibacterota bacterium]
MNNRFIKLLGENDRTLIDCANITITSITDGVLWIDCCAITSNKEHIDKFIRGYSAYKGLEEELVRGVLIEANNKSI